jgi:hypothetical protein
MLALLGIIARFLILLFFANFIIRLFTKKAPKKESAPRYKKPEHFNDADSKISDADFEEIP